MAEQYTVVAEFHDQPPIDTQAKHWKIGRTFEKTETLEDVFDWIELNRSGAWIVNVEVLTSDRRERC
jgi:hypothetical protein